MVGALFQNFNYFQRVYCTMPKPTISELGKNSLKEFFKDSIRNSDIEVDYVNVTNWGNNVNDAYILQVGKGSMEGVRNSSIM